MNNLKKVGLTALAGSLVASTAYAGALSVSGSAGVKYQSKSGSAGTAAIQGNPWSDSNGITFSGGGVVSVGGAGVNDNSAGDNSAGGGTGTQSIAPIIFVADLESPASFYKKLQP